MASSLASRLDASFERHDAVCLLAGSFSGNSVVPSLAATSEKKSVMLNSWFIPFNNDNFICLHHSFVHTCEVPKLGFNKRLHI